MKIAVFLLLFSLCGLSAQTPSPSSSTAPSSAKSGTPAAPYHPMDYIGMERGLRDATTCGNTKEAFKMALEILRNEPVTCRDSVVYAAIESLGKLRVLDEYQRKLKTYYKDDPTNLHYNMIMARCYQWSNSPRAYDYFERIFQVDPTNTEARDALIAYYNQTKNYDQSARIFDYMLRNDFPAAMANPYLVFTYMQAKQIDQLFDLYQENVRHAMPSPGVLGSIQAWPYLEQGLKDANRKDKLLAYYRLFTDNENTGNVNERFALIDMLGATGDNQGVGDACEKALFREPFHLRPEFNSPGATERIYDLWHSDYQFSLTRVAELIRKARAAGQIERLKSRARIEVAAHPDLSELRQTLLLISLYGHDSEAPDLLKNYYASLPISDPGPRGRDLLSYAILDEIGGWPEGHARAQAGLKLVFQYLAPPHPQVYWYSLAAYDQAARAALKLNETEMAQTVLENGLEPTISTDRAILQGVNVPNGEMPDFSVLSDTGDLLVQAGMRKELSMVIPMIADPKRSLQEITPTSRSQRLTRLGEGALQEGWISEATLAARAATKVLLDTWNNPGENSNGTYSKTINADGIHLTFDLLVRLDLDDEFQNLYTLISRPLPPGSTLDHDALVRDAVKVRNTYGNHPIGLIPVAWLSAETSGTLESAVNWNANATVPPPEQRQGRDFESASPPRPPEDETRSSFSISLRDLPKLDRKFTLQILAGPSADKLRIVKSISGASCRGSAGVRFQSGDRYIQAIGQTDNAQSGVFTGPVLPICLAANLAPASAWELKAAENADPLKLLGVVLSPPESVPGGPVAGGSFFQKPSSTDDLPLELVGPLQAIKRGITYAGGGWLLSGAGTSPTPWGVRFFDRDGKKITDRFFDAPSPGDGWHFEQFSFYTGGSELGRHAYTVPDNAVSFVPFLQLASTDSAKEAWQGLYLGILDQEPIPPDLDRTLVMTGLNGAVKIIEAPQGNLLAVAFADGTVRCFDLQAKREVGTAAHLNAAPGTIAFFNKGEDVVATDDHQDVTVRAVQNFAWDVIQSRMDMNRQEFRAAKMIYHAPWKIDLMAASENGSIIAVGNRQSEQAIVIDLTTGKELCRINAGKLAGLCLSPEGKYLDGWDSSEVHTLWDASSGDSKLKDIRVNLGVLAHFLNIGYPMQVSTSPSAWLQTKDGFLVTSDSSSLTYTQIDPQTLIHHFDTGPISTFCPSSSSTNTYAIDGSGNLVAWKLPDGLEIPPSVVTPDQENIFGDIPPEISPVPAPPQFSVTASPKLRGFPLTTLNTPLEVTVLDKNRQPIIGARIRIQTNLDEVKFKFGEAEAKRRLETRTDEKGHVSVAVVLGKITGHGKITVTVTSKGQTQQLDVPIESIDEKQVLKDVSNLGIWTDGETADILSWNDESGGEETGFLIERKVEGWNWQAIAILPEGANSFSDYGNNFCQTSTYRITPINSSKYGYPPKLPPLPDCLGDFVP